MKFPKFLKKKRNIIIIAIIFVVIIIIVLASGKKNGAASIQTGFVEKHNLQETVLSTGQVVSETDLNLSFQNGGVVRQILVKEGDVVKKGKLLASLDESSAQASLTTAQGALAQAQANYEKLVAGATTQTVKITQDSVNSAELDLTSAYNGAMATLNSGYTAIYNSSILATNIKNNYFAVADSEGIAVQIAKTDLDKSLQNAKTDLSAAQTSLSQQDIDSAVTAVISSLSSAYSDIASIRAQCELDIYTSKVSATDKASLDAQKTVLITAQTATTTFQQNIASLKIVLQRAKDQLDQTVAPPTTAEVDLAEAQILSARGQVALAQATYDNSQIRAPADGTITQVDIKVGEQATPMKEVMVLQDIGDLHTESDVSEANIASLEVGQSIDYTFDALGPDQHFQGKVLTINPSSTVVSGVVNYKVTGSLDNVPKIKPGMTANMTIMVAEKDNALAVPSTAVISRGNKYYVRVVDNHAKKTYHEAEVQTGLQADGGLIEITSGLTDGQEIVVFKK